MERLCALCTVLSLVYDDNDLDHKLVLASMLLLLKATEGASDQAHVVHLLRK